MIQWKIIILIIIIKILSFILSQYYTNKHVHKILNENRSGKHDIDVEEENNICITPIEKEFTVCWIKFTIDLIGYSKAIILKNPEHQKYYTQLENTKTELIKLFKKINYENSQEFETLINAQISIKIDLCNSILYNDNKNTDKYSQELTENTKKLSNLFSLINKTTENEISLKNTMNNHSNKYIKSMHLINKIGDDEITRELIFGSIDTAKLLFI